VRNRNSRSNTHQGARTYNVRPKKKINWRWNYWYW